MYPLVLAGKCLSVPGGSLSVTPPQHRATFVTNPPYIPSKEINSLEPEVRYYDPILAIDGGNDGLDAYRSIIPKLKNLLKPNGKIFVEIGKKQEDSVSKIGLQNELISFGYKKDLSNINRVIVFNIK